MLRKLPALIAAAGLLVSASAGPRPDSALRAKKLEARQRARGHARMLPDRANGAALPSGIDVNRAIRQARQGREPGPLPGLDGTPFEGHAEQEVAVNAPAGSQWCPAVAFDGTNYLVVWEDGSGDISGALVTQSGSPVDPEEGSFVISQNTPLTYQWCASVAFDGTNFLVVWEDWRDDDFWVDIYGARVSQSGAVVSGDENGILISENTEETDQWSPAVAFDGTNFLVVWRDSRDQTTWENDVYGARVSKAGAVLDPGGFLVSRNTAASSQWAPAVAFDGTDYLVVWEDDRRGGWDIYGARVSTGARARDLDGIGISTAAGDQVCPVVAFDGTDFLVAWEDRRDEVNWYSDIYGARVSQLGAVVTGDEGGILFTPETPTSNQRSPAVAFDGTDYLLVWSDDRNTNWYDIYACQVSLARDVGAAYAVSNRANNYPAVAGGPAEGTVLAAYESYTGGANRVRARAGTLPLTGDVGTVSIVRPVASFLVDETSWPVPPSAQVANSGDEPRSFKATFTIGDWSSTRTVLGLRKNAPREVEFDPFTLTTGLFTPTCATELVHDEVAGNNTMSASFQGCDFIDFFDFGAYGFTASSDGRWTRGKPVKPNWTWPPMDSFVWGVGVGGNYNAGENTTLTSPTYRATRDNPAIAFQHTFSTQAGHDGGNFSYSTDNGSNWFRPTPVAGLEYTGTVSALGEQGWSGSSAGWRQSVFTLGEVGTGEPFILRWHFASDVGPNGAGWLIDEVAGVNCGLSLDGRWPQKGDSVVAALDVSPNPVSTCGQVSYTLLKDCDVSIKLYDVTGALVAPVRTAGFSRGSHTARMDVTGLRSGVYFLKMEGQGDFRSTKVIIQ